MHVIVLVAGLREGHELAPSELDVARFGFKREPCFVQRGTGQWVNRVGGDHFVDVSVGIEPDRVIGHGQGVGVASAGRDAEVAERNATTGVRVNSNWNGGRCTARPQSHALIEFDVKAVCGVEGRGVVVDDVQINEVKRGPRRSVRRIDHETEEDPVAAKFVLVCSSNRRVGEQRVERTNEVERLAEHFLHDGGAVGHVAEHNGLRTRHQAQFKAFAGVTIGTNGHLVHAEVCCGDFRPFGEKEEAAHGLAADPEGERGFVSGVVDVVNGP